MDATTIGIDLAKDVFEVAISARPGQVGARRRLTRRQFSQFVDMLVPQTTVVMEACGTAHYWARRCQARGAAVQLVPPRYVRPYVRRNKTDRTDAEALLEAHRCAGIHPVPVKTVEQQTIQTLHRVRQQWQTTRTARINLVRAILREQGLTLPAGAHGLRRRLAVLLADETAVPSLTRETLHALLDELGAIDARLAAMDARLGALARTHPLAIRLQQIPGVGPLTATALVGSVPHLHAFRRGRAFASWLGLTPRVRASGHRRQTGRISKEGDRYLRTLLAHGARSVLRTAARHPESRLHQWAATVATRRGQPRAIMAVANKLARIIWAVGHGEQTYAMRPAR
jgi:transposase